MRNLTNAHLLKSFTNMLDHFVQSFIILYEKKFVFHIVHGILHIVNDTNKFDTLDEFSAFPLEHYMCLLAGKINIPEKPLNRRYIEQKL